MGDSRLGVTIETATDTSKVEQPVVKPVVEQPVVKPVVDDSPVKSLIGGMKSAIGAATALRAAISRVFAALGIVGFVITGVTALVNTFKKVREWAGRAREEAKKLREEVAAANWESAVKSARKAYEELNKAIAETNHLLERRNSLEDTEKSSSRAIEDAQLEADRQQALARLDPTAQDYDEKRRRIENLYDNQKSFAEYERAKADNQTARARLAEKADARDRDAERYGELATDQRFNVHTARFRYEEALAAAKDQKSGGGAEVENLKKILDDEIAKYENLVRMRNAAKTEANELREDASALEGADEAARIRYETEVGARAAGERNAAAVRAMQEQERKKDEKYEGEARARRFVEAWEEDQEKEREKSVGSLKDDISSLSGLDLNSGNRLTALGLGDGSSSSSLDRSVATIIDLIRQQIQAVKDNKPEKPEGAVYQP